MTKIHEIQENLYVIWRDSLFTASQFGFKLYCNNNEENKMKCFLHPEAEAIGVCTRCGKGLCRECDVELGGKLYCKTCANESFNKLNRPVSEVSGWFYLLPLFFGLLGGLFAFFYDNNFKKNKNRAKNMLGFGIIISILWVTPVLIPLIFVTPRF
jgi:hypothetical protein